MIVKPKGVTYLLCEKMSKRLGIINPFNHTGLRSGGDDFIGANTQTTSTGFVIV